MSQRSQCARNSFRTRCRHDGDVVAVSGAAPGVTLEGGDVVSIPLPIIGQRSDCACLHKRVCCTLEVLPSVWTHPRLREG